jgi:hypothetical protein
MQPGCEGCCSCGIILIMELGLMAASLDLTVEVSSLFSQCERTTCHPQPDPALEPLPSFIPGKSRSDSVGLKKHIMWYLITRMLG